MICSRCGGNGQDGMSEDPCLRCGGSGDEPSSLPGVDWSWDDEVAA